MTTKTDELLDELSHTGRVLLDWAHFTARDFASTTQYIADQWRTYLNRKDHR